MTTICWTVLKIAVQNDWRRGGWVVALICWLTCGNITGKISSAEGELSAVDIGGREGAGAVFELCEECGLVDKWLIITFHGFRQAQNGGDRTRRARRRNRVMSLGGKCCCAWIIMLRRYNHFLVYFVRWSYNRFCFICIRICGVEVRLAFNGALRLFYGFSFR